MKIRTALITVALVAMLVFTACAVKETALEVNDVAVIGNAADFVKVTDGTYTLKKVDGGLELTLKAELQQECTQYDPDSLEIGNWNLSFMNAEGIAVIGMENVPLREEHKAEIVALMKGEIGGSKDLTFFQTMADKAEIKRVLGEVANIALNTEIIFPDAEMMTEEEMVPEETAPVASNVQPKPKPTPTPPVPTPPVPTPPAPPAQSENWDAKLGEYETAVDRYLAMKAQNPVKPMDIKRLQDQRTKVQTLENSLGAAPDMTTAQITRYGRIKAKMN